MTPETVKGRGQDRFREGFLLCVCRLHCETPQDLRTAGEKGGKNWVSRFPILALGVEVNSCRDFLKNLSNKERKLRNIPETESPYRTKILL